ncbi:CHAT domain-containing protein [Streptomyces sp. NPDC005017]|uniref:CHAT domain-containing protein n=1 Tax=Streptomyces sp. NPDC005017 TaxID=3364706 RepID=UPI00368AE267
MKLSLASRPRLALALWRAHRATVDGRFPRRTDRAVDLLETALGSAGREHRVALLEGIAALHTESARRGGGPAAAERAVEALRRALAEVGGDGTAPHEGTRHGRSRHEAATNERRTRAAGPDEPGPDEAVILARLADAQETLYGMTGDTDRLREAVATARLAAERAPDDPLTLMMVLTSVAGLLLRAGSGLDDPALLEETVTSVEKSLAAGGGSPLQLAQAHRLLYEHDGEAGTLARAEAAARDAVARCEEHGLDAADEYAELAQVLRYRFGDTGDPGLAREAATAAREALARTAEGDEEGSKRACLLAGALTECHYAGDPGALAEAVAVVRAATAAEAATPYPESAGGDGVTAVGTRGDSAARGSDADGTAIRTHATQGHSATPGSHTDDMATRTAEPRSAPASGDPRSDVWQITAAVLCAWAEQHADGGAAEEAEGSARTALVLAGGDDQRRAVALDTLSDVLRCRYLLGEDPELLAEAIAYGEAAASMETGPPGDRAGRIGNLGVLLRLRHEETGSPTDLDAAIGRYTDALALLGDDHPDAGMHFTNLGSALAARTRLHGAADELDEAIAAGRAAVRGGGPAHQRVLRLSNLGGELYQRYTRDGDLADLDEDIDLQREALRLVPRDHPDRAGLLGNLATALTERHEVLGVRGDLSEALALLEQAMAAGPAPRRLATLAGAHGLALHAHHGVTGDPDALERALVSLRTAVASTAPADPYLPLLLANLATSLRDASLRDVSPRDTSTHRTAAATEAVDTARAALTALDDGWRATAVRGSLLLALAARSGEGDLDEAVLLARRVVADTSPDDPDLARSLANLAYVLNLRHEADGGAGDRAATHGLERPTDPAAEPAPQRPAHPAAEPAPQRPADPADEGVTKAPGEPAEERDAQESADLAEAHDALRAAALTGTGPAGIRLNAARGWGRLAARRGDARAAAEAFALGVELLPDATPRRLERPDAQRRLAEAAGLASDAAAMCLACGDPERALSLLELGRGVLLGRLSGIRADLAELHDADDTLARRFEELRDALDRLDHPPLPLPDRPPAAGTTGRERERRRDLEAELELVVRRIRALPGQEGFQRPPSVASLLAEAEHGPVVVVNVSEYRCDALLLTAEGLRHVPLDDLDADELERAADLFHTDVVTALDTRAAQEDVDAANERVVATLDLLWREVAAPVLAELRLPHPDTRVWWVPTQALCRLPLHAATAAPDASQSPPDGTAAKPPADRTPSPDAVADGTPGLPESLVDRTVSSYTPTVTALHHARARGAAPEHAVAAVVHADVRRPGLAELPAALREARAAADRLGVEPLDLAECERAVLIDALVTCTYLHLALHAVADQRDPGASRFLLPDLDLTFAEIAARRGGWGRLAYLSACETTYTPRDLADEAIHLTSAFLLVGFSGVIGTLWRTPDAVAETTAREFYDALDDVPDEPAVALARAVRLNRVNYSDDPAAWAAHHHVGS